MTLFDQETVRRTVVVLDLSHYSPIVSSLEIGHKMGANATLFVNKQIEDLVRRAADDAGSDYSKCFVKGTGDGAILQFETTEAGEQFAMALHKLSYSEHCQDAATEFEWRSFRVGIYAGEVAITPHEIAGMAVTFATRLEAGARTGQIVIDVKSWADLPVKRKAAYGPEEQLQIKAHDTVLTVRRCNVVESAPWDKEKQESSSPTEHSPQHLPSRDQNPSASWKRILRITSLCLLVLTALGVVGWLIWLNRGPPDFSGDKLPLLLDEAYVSKDERLFLGIRFAPPKANKYSIVLTNVSTKKIKIEEYGCYSGTAKYELDRERCYFDASHFKMRYRANDWIEPNTSVRCDNVKTDSVLWAFSGVDEDGKTFIAGKVKH